MARGESKKLEVRDMDAQDEVGYLTKPRAQVDLERRTEEGYVPDSAVGTSKVLQPNPFGEDEYVGTDPIYQNYANDQNKPLAAEDGVEKELVEAHREMYPEGDVEDPGTGGKTTEALSGTAARTYRTVMPGQEGYDRDKAEEQNAPPLRVYADEEASSDDDSDDDEAVGPEVQTPTSPAAPLVQDGSDDNSNAK